MRSETTKDMAGKDTDEKDMAGKDTARKKIWREKSGAAKGETASNSSNNNTEELQYCPMPPYPPPG